jgi:23S rRNA (pseudouridine1915-N3)-methyltransferase
MNEMPFLITIVSLGKRNSAIDEEAERYVGLIRPYSEVKNVVIRPPVHESVDRSRLVHEGRLLKEKWPKGSSPVALSEDGRLMNSVKFAQWIERLMTNCKQPVFNIGGAYGLSSEIKNECADVISLSPMTMPHKLCMIVLLEQIYRAFTILNHHPYHK